MINGKPFSLLGKLTALTALFVFAQFSFFVAHCEMAEVIDSLVTTSIILQMLNAVVLLPLIGFILIQAAAYGLFVSWIWFITISLSELCRLSTSTTNVIGIVLWLLACYCLLELNAIYYPKSFFSLPMNQVFFLNQYGVFGLYGFLSILFFATVIAFFNFFRFKRYRGVGIMLFSLIIAFAAVKFYFHAHKTHAMHEIVNQQSLQAQQHQQQPNIIFIGLDSLRPDFIRYYHQQSEHTPNIDNFLVDAFSFSQAYTPLARTFPAWISILTAKYPKHSGARNNLNNQDEIVINDTLAKRLQGLGYQTIYATDEKRFSNITQAYGFDKILGPGMGVNDFLLGGLSDFPMNNLMVNTLIGELLLPYNYGNRAENVTYRPNSFLNLVQGEVSHLANQPVFLAVHLCLAHWPYTWAKKTNDNNPVDLYRTSVNRLDNQFGALMKILKQNGLLANTWIVLLSDHGTALGLPNDKLTNKEKYVGDAERLRWMPVLKIFNNKNNRNNNKYNYSYGINTAYGQGTNVLSLTQAHVLLAFKQFSNSFPMQNQSEKNNKNKQINKQVNKQINNLNISSRVSLLDIAPTILNLLNQKPLLQVDGVSLRQYLVNNQPQNATTLRPLFIETGDSLSEIETDHIYIEKVLKREIGIYHISAKTGLLTITMPAEQSIIHNKQFAILQGDWILARYPASKSAMTKKIIPPYYVLANIKTGRWTIALSASEFYHSLLAKAVPIASMLEQLQKFL